MCESLGAERVVGHMVQEEAGYKLLKVTRQQVGKGGVPYIATHDGRTIRYPDPDIKVRLLLACITKKDLQASETVHARTTFLKGQDCLRYGKIWPTSRERRVQTVLAKPAVVWGGIV
jgi:ribosomal protein S4E